MVDVVYYLIVCRSLTYAQRTELALSRAGIPGRILRSPKAIDADGCSHSVRVLERDLGPALVALKRAGLPPKRVFVATGEEYREVEP